MPLRYLPLLLPALLLYPVQILQADILFADISDAAGLTHSIGGEGVCIIDFNNDGLEDIFFAGSGNQNRLYRNDGNMVFSEISESAGVAHTGRSRLAIGGDYDNDGFIDLVIGCHEEPSRLFRNNGDWTFTEVSTEAGVLTSEDARGGAWFDHDSDGFLDLYIGNLGASNMLYRSNGDNTFTDIAGAVNARGPDPSLVLGLAIFDYDRDGDDDIFMAQDGNQGNMLLERRANGIYYDVSDEAGVILPVQGMGVGVGDYNRDGFFDVYTTNLNESTLLQNNGDRTFTDVTIPAGVGDSPNHMGWGTFFFDSDNDGLLDIYNNNQTNFGGLPNTFFHNNGDGTFEDLSAASGLMCYNNGIGSACGDLDNDGDLDIVLSGRPAAAGNLKLFRNDSNTPHHWVQVSLQASGGNRNAIGAIVELFSGGVVQTSMVSGGAGYVSQISLRQHFGLGLAETIDSLIVSWPDGSREVFHGLAVDTHHLLVEGTTTGVIDEENQLSPQTFFLGQNYPNPFNPSTRIDFTIPEAGHVSLAVFDLLGRHIGTLVDGPMERGTYTIEFGRADLPTGLYVYRLQMNEHTLLRRMLLLR